MGPAFFVVREQIRAVLRLYLCRQQANSKNMDRTMNNQNKIKTAVAALAVAALVAAVAVPTVLALRDDESVSPELIIDPQAQARLAAGELDVDTEAQGMIEPMFITGEPVTPFDGEVTTLPDGTVSISNPDVEPMPMPLPGELSSDTLPVQEIAIGEPHPPMQEPALERTDGAVSGSSSASVGPAVDPVVVNASDLPPARAPEPGVVRVVPIGTFLNDVQID